MGAVLGIIISFAGTGVAQGQFVPIPPWLTSMLGILSGGARESTQLLNHGELISIVANALKQLEQQINMYKDMVVQSRKLNTHSFSGILQDINQLSGLVQTGAGLTYALGSVEAKYLETYQGWLPASYPSRQRWLQASLDTSRGVLRAVNQQYSQLQSVDGLLNTLRGQASTAEGRLQSLQILGEMAHEQVSQLERLNVLLMADISAKAVHQASVAQQQGSAAATEEWFFNHQRKPMKGITWEVRPK